MKNIAKFYNKICPDCSRDLILVIIEDLSMYECPYRKAMYYQHETKEKWQKSISDPKMPQRRIK